MGKHKRDSSDKHRSASSSSFSISSSIESNKSDLKRLSTSGEYARQAEHREKVKKRSRMWTTVDSDSESSSNILKNNKLDQETDVDADINHEKVKKEKKEKKERKHDEKRKDKKEKDRKHKKHSKHKKDEKHRKSGLSAVNQDEFGKYGILKESDFFKKQQEFEIWLLEQKQIGDTSQLQKYELKEYFKMYMEDYNTATLPHEKYINYSKWEVDQYEENKRKEEKKLKKYGSGLTDAAELELERKRAKKLKEKEEFDNMIMATMRKGKVEEMRNQELLRSQMQLAYRQGDSEKVRSIEARLAPDLDPTVRK